METPSPTPQAPAPPSPLHGILKRIFYHPTVAAISSVLGIVGFFIGIAFYYAAKREPNLTYYVSPTRTAIVQSGTLENLSVSLAGHAITNDISAVHVQIWNQGRQAIHAADILKPISIRLGGNAHLLTAITKPLRDTSISQPMARLETNGLDLIWKTLENSDGLNVQIIYEGNVKVPISIDGVVEGQQRISPFNSKPTDLPPIAQLFIGLFVGATGIFYSYILKQIRGASMLRFTYDAIKKKRRIDLVESVCAILVIILLGISICILVSCLWSGRLFMSNPPFGL